jgi:uncharacterized membrane protein YidH (DUF202 family)
VKPVDDGRQPERTALSWNRTALAVAVNAALVLRAAFVGGLHPELLGLALMLLVAAGATVLLGHRRQRHLAAGSTARSVHAHSMLAVVVCAWLACAGGLVVMLGTPHGAGTGNGPPASPPGAASGG